MSRKAKQLVTDEYTQWFDGVNGACVVDLSGLDAISTHRLRGELREKGIQLRVVKNALARRAFAGGPLEPVGKSLLGPCALVCGGDSVVEMAKELVRLAKEMDAITLRDGMIEGDAELVPVEELAKLKTRAELQGEVIMLALSPWRRIAGQITSPWARLAGCAKAIAERGKEGGESQAA